MKVIEDVQQFRGVLPHVALTIGSFDGIHRGHQRILRTVIDRARDENGTAALLTMRPHPRELFSPDHAPNLLTSDEMKLKLLEEFGLDVVFFLPFTTEVANLDRRDFIERIVVCRCVAKHLVVGHDFCFGKDALGDYNFLLETAPEWGFTVEQVPPVLVDGERVSSTLVRERILEGNLAKAELFLGRKYAIEGTVISGRGIGGSKLGYPTANIQPHHSAIPAQGVYIARALTSSASYAAAVNIGIAPTVRHEDLMIEAFLLDFHGDLVGQRVQLIFHQRLRPERKFPSYEALRGQIYEDVEAVRAYFVETETPEA